MKPMTPREALYYICLELGPIAETNRDDNLTERERRLRDSIRALQNFIHYHDDTSLNLPDSATEYGQREPDGRGDGKDRIDAWRRDWKNYGQ